jgi:glucose-6-phosphate 1-epimerase
MVDRSNKPAPLPKTPLTTKAQPTVDYDADAARVTAKLPSGQSVTVLLHGATVISWKNSNGSENLWLSEKSALDGSKPVRGGIPIVFPVFGPPPSGHATSSLPQHGFARSTRWEYLGKSTTETTGDEAGDDDSGSVKLDFGLYRAGLSEDSKKKWGYDFALVYSVTLSKSSLQTMISVRNEGQEAFEFHTLLHTYLRVKDISTTTVTGLLGTTYTDKVLDASTATESNNQLSITGEIDRVYHSISQNTTSVLEQVKSRFDVVRDNVDDTVVWNPWREKAQAMGDFEPKDGYKQMLCVEVGSVSGWTKLEGGETWEGGQIIKSLE